MLNRQVDEGAGPGGSGVQVRVEKVPLPRSGSLAQFESEAGTLSSRELEQLVASQHCWQAIVPHTRVVRLLNCKSGAGTL